MATSGAIPRGSLTDAITPDPNTRVQSSGGSGRASSHSSAVEHQYDDKKAPAPVAEYDVDPEKQSDRIGSVRRGVPEGDVEEAGWRRERGSGIWVMDGRWLSFSWIWNTFRPLWHFLIWGTFTALVPLPPPTNCYVRCVIHVCAVSRGE